MEQNLQTPPDRPSARAPKLAVGHGAEEHDDELPPSLTPQSIGRPNALWVVLALVAVLGGLGGVFMLGWLPLKNRQETLTKEAELVANAPMRVAVVSPKRGDATQELLLPSHLEAIRETTLYARTSGYLKNVFVDIGDHVDAGKKLAEIDAPEVDMQLEQSRAAQAQAEAALAQTQAALAQAQAQQANSEAAAELADITMKRYDSMRGSNAITEQDLSQKEADVKTTHAAVRANQAAVLAAQANIASANANIKAAKADVARLNILKAFEVVTAPFAGTITARSTELGALVTAGSTGGTQPLFELACTDPVRVFVDIPQSVASDVKLGQHVELIVHEHADKQYSGTVVRTAGAVDRTSRMLRTEIHIPNPKGELFVGTFAQVKLTIEHAAPPLLLPGSALVVNASGTQVALVKNGHVHFQLVTLDGDYGSNFGVSLGLTEQDQVIATPSERLTEGAEVTVVPASK